MAQPAAYRVRLRAQLANALNTADVSRVITLAGRAVTIASQMQGQPLSEAVWIILGAGGFASEEAAREFGEQLRTITEVAGVCSRLGVDVGLNQPTTWMNESLARSSGIIGPHERLLPNIHGLMVFPDDGNTRIPLVQAELTVRHDPAQFEGAMVELAAELPVRLSTGAQGVRVLNLALMNPQPLAQIALALSAVEALGQDEAWTDAQVALIDELATGVETRCTDQDTERLEVAKALRRSLHRIGLRQGVMRVLARLDLQRLRTEWDRVYDMRSGIFHGTLRLSDPEIGQLAADALALCARIILTLAERDGVKLPAISSVHFPLE